MPRRRRKSLPYSGNPSCTRIPESARRRLRSSVMSVPNSSKSLGHGQRPVGGDVEAVRLAGGVGVAHPEHLGERDRGVVALVAEYAEDHAEPGAVAQPDRPGGAGDLVALRLVEAEDVRAERPLPGLRARRLVVGNAVGRQQQRGDRVHDRGLARADVAGEQRGPRVRVQRPDVLVESAPVVQLKAGQAESAERLRHSSSPVTRPAYSASFSSKSASHWPSTKAFRMRRTS